MKLSTDGRQVGLWNRRRDDIFESAPIDRYESDGAPIPWLGNRVDLDALDRYDEQATSVVRDQHYQQALEFHRELEGNAAMWLDHARVRQAEADYLEHRVFPHTRNYEYLRLAQKLRDARPMAFWGVDPFDEEAGPIVQWVNRAGEAKLCPDDARCIEQRAVKRHVDRIVELGEQGYHLRFGVLTVPNAAQGHLGACLDSTFLRWRHEIMYARTDGRIARRVDDPKRRFPDLVGAWGCIEDPLSARYAHDRTAAWNVHLNVICAFRERPDYSALGEAWGAWIKFKKIQQGSRDAAIAAIRELIKYSIKAVSKKTLEKASSGKTHAPPMIEWPPEYFDEWWHAHKGFRRARNWGVLHGGKLPPEEKRDPNRCDWIGRIKLSVAFCDVSRPMPDYMATRDRARERGEYRAAVAADVAAAQAREAARIYSIQGTIHARPPARAGPGPPEKTVSEWLSELIASETDNPTPD